MTEKSEKKVKKIKKEQQKPQHSVMGNRLKLKEQKSNQHAVTGNRLKLLVTTVPRNKAEFYADLIQSFEVNMQMFALAEGTANATTLSLLGLADSSRTVIFSVIKENKIKDCLAELENKFNSVKGGKGIAFTVPLTSVIGTLIYGFLSNNTKLVKENKK